MYSIPRNGNWLGGRLGRTGGADHDPFGRGSRGRHKDREMEIGAKPLKTNNRVKTAKRNAS
jgi:hypothetical protein